MTATRVQLAPEYDRYAGLPMPNQLHGWLLDDAGPYELEGRGGLFVRAACLCGRRKQYVSRASWIRGTFPSKQCVVCDRSRKRSKGTAAYTRPTPRNITPYYREGNR